jgi:predicted Zn-dependent protease
VAAFYEMKSAFWRSVVLFCAVSGVIQKSRAESISFIRDSEIESAIYAIVCPLARAAGLDEKSIRIYIISSSAVNAAASGDGRIFINTGLILKIQTVYQLKGVLAHELGHIAAHHSARRAGIEKTLSAAAMASIFLGCCVGIAGGRPDLAFGAVSAGTSMAASAFCHHSQQEEAAADALAVKILHSLGCSAKGLIEFLAILRKQEQLLGSDGDIPAYFRTHPGTQERIESLKEKEIDSDRPAHAHQDSRKEEKNFRLMKEKLLAWWAPLDRVLQQRESNGNKTAEAIMLYRQGHLQEALNCIETHLAQEASQKPYLLELKAQILLEKKDVSQAISVYREALAALPLENSAPLIQLSLAHALLETKDPADLVEALKILNSLTAVEKDNPNLWHLLAVGYGRQGDEGRAALSLAEEALALGDEKRARQYALRARKKIPKNTPLYARVCDLLEYLKTQRHTKK